jgi:hypothetical protein
VAAEAEAEVEPAAAQEVVRPELGAAPAEPVRPEQARAAPAPVRRERDRQHQKVRRATHNAAQERQARESATPVPAIPIARTGAEPKSATRLGAGGALSVRGAGFVGQSCLTPSQLALWPKRAASNAQVANPLFVPLALFVIEPVVGARSAPTFAAPWSGRRAASSDIPPRSLGTRHLRGRDFVLGEAHDYADAPHPSPFSARAANGQSAAPPSSVINARRSISPGLLQPWRRPVSLTHVQNTGEGCGQVLGVYLGVRAPTADVLLVEAMMGPRAGCDSSI